jgi:hypothetical protein
MAARVPANRKSAAENTAPPGLAAMAWRMVSDVRMSEIMHVFGIFQTDQSSALFVATCPSPPCPQVQPQKRKKEHQSSFVSQNNLGLCSGPAFSTR